MKAVFFLGETTGINPLFMNVISALLILFIGFIVGKVVGLLIQKIFHQLSVDEKLATAGYRTTLKKLIGNTFTILIYGAAIVLALLQLDILNYALIIVGGGALLIIGISLFLLIFDAFLNLFAGLYLTYFKRIIPGDRITIRSISGTVLHVGLFVAIIHEREDLLRVPNRLFLKEPYGFINKRKRH
jgi:small-conductance mechanosensitive channel